MVQRLMPHKKWLQLVGSIYVLTHTYCTMINVIYFNDFIYKYIVGVCNIMGSFVSAYPATGSFSRWVIAAILNLEWE